MPGAFPEDIPIISRLNTVLCCHKISTNLNKDIILTTKYVYCLPRHAMLTILAKPDLTDLRAAFATQLMSPPHYYHSQMLPPPKNWNELMKHPEKEEYLATTKLE